MPEYLSPGVYVEEVSSGIRPIEGVGTSTGAFIGIAEKGPIGGAPASVAGLALPALPPEPLLLPLPPAAPLRPPAPPLWQLITT